MEQTNKSFSELRLEENKRMKELLNKKSRTEEEEEELDHYYAQDIWDFM